MPLPLGSRVGPYEIVAAIGAGGMGEVYRARDTRLNRDVALKILPETFAGDPDRLARFEREAQVLASLNHPHIAHLYGLEESSAIRALAMELVEGEDLRARIARGPVPLDEARTIATQIASALQAAHEIGVIHRDLKPANVMLRSDGTVKVLDFGLARALDDAAETTGDVTQSPTITSPAGTMQGVMLGTAAYMAPEQARGQRVDKRADMWAFGCVLYEMLTGQRPFDGALPADVIAQVIAGEPDWAALPRGLPDGVTRVLRRCLEKNVQRRLRDAADARLDLEDPFVATVHAPVRRRPRWQIAAAMIAIGATALAAGVAIGRGDREAAPAPVLRTTILLPRGHDFQTGRRAVAISADAQQIVYSAREGLYVRPLDAFESRLIPGTANGINPAFSPDGRRLAVWTLQGVRSIDVLTGSGTALRVPAVTLGGILPSLSWDAHGLLLTQGAAGVYLYPPDGGDPRRVVELEPGEAASAAQMLPGGEHVLMTVLAQTPLRPGAAAGRVVVQSLSTGVRTAVVESGSDARYVSSGHVLYAADGALYAVEFDATALRTRGEPVAIVEGVRATNTVNATTHYAVSDNGVLAYVAGQPLPPARALDLVRVERAGEVRHLHLPAAPYESPRVSPDGRYVAMGTDDDTDASIWIHDMTQPASIRKLTVGGRNRFPVWSHDGRRIAFQSDREGDVAIFVQAADGSDAPVRLTKADAGTRQTPEAWSPDGRDLLFNVANDAGTSLWRLSLASGRVEPFGNVTSGTPTAAAFSPDGRWVAYNTTVSASVIGGGHVTFVQPFPATGAIYQISRDDDGHHPVWSRGGRELFYIPGPGLIYGITVSGTSSFTFSAPTPLPPAGLMGPGTVGRNFDVLPDGSGFVGRQIAEDEESRLGAPPRIHVVSNWLGGLNRRPMSP